MTKKDLLKMLLPVYKEVKKVYDSWDAQVAEDLATAEDDCGDTFGGIKGDELRGQWEERTSQLSDALSLWEEAFTNIEEVKELLETLIEEAGGNVG